MAEIDEKDLVERLKRREEAAFNDLVRHYQGRIYGLTFRMMGNASDAEEVAQEVFITVFKSIDSFRGDSKLSTWLYRVTANHCKNRIKFLSRRAQNRKRNFEEMQEGDVGTEAAIPTTTPLARPDEQLQGLQLEAVIQRALSEIDDEHRELIVLRDIKNMPYDEMVEVTGKPLGTIKSGLHRARTALANRVRELTGDDPRISGGGKKAVAK